MLIQLSRASRARSAVAAVSHVARPNAVQVRGFIAPTVSRKGKTLSTLLYASRSMPLGVANTSSRPPISPGRICPSIPESALHLSSDVAKQPASNARYQSGFELPDFVQELYLKELKAYKIPAVKESDAEGNVQTFNVPKTPASPEETDLAGNLKEYESMAVEIEGQDSSAQSGTPEVADWLEAEEEDEPHH
ncbi:hypothetical protein LB504_000839 [Fusarium proliferatum]|nr:hypothetical protein LB504_000839 [Fusarium proliferatum]